MMAQRHPDPAAVHGICPRLTGALPSSRHLLLAAVPWTPLYAPAPQSALVPKQMDYWGNNQYGNCTVAEEAFAKACYQPEIFVPANVVIAWGAGNGFNNGATLTDPMDQMAKKGFVVGAQEYRDGPHQAVDYSNEAVLQAALSTGDGGSPAPVKLGMASGALPSGAGNQQGWYAIQAKTDHSEDHCTGLSGYGSADWLYQQLGMTKPSGVNFPSVCYLFYTWSTLGVVSHDWIMGCVGEAWVRSPTTLGVPPLPPPAPVDYYI